MVIILEKDNKNVNGDLSSATDYTKEIDDEEEETEDTQETDESDDNSEATDYTEEVEDDDTDIEGDDVDVDEGEYEATDYTEDEDLGDDVDGETDTDSEGDGTETEEEIEEEPEVDVEEQKANTELLNDFINFYRSITNIKNKINFIEGDISLTSIYNQVVSNLTILESYVYNYIVNFNDFTYTQNLYKYNYFLEAFKVNLKMLEMVKTVKNQVNT